MQGLSVLDESTLAHEFSLHHVKWSANSINVNVAHA